jgi:hypothetical protein
LFQNDDPPPDDDIRRLIRTNAVDFESTNADMHSQQTLVQGFKSFNPGALNAGAMLQQDYLDEMI